MTAVPLSMSGAVPGRRFAAHDVRGDLATLHQAPLHPAMGGPVDVPLPLPTARAAANAERPLHSPVAVPARDPAAVERERQARTAADRAHKADIISAVYRAVDAERQRHRVALEGARVAWHEAGERTGYTRGVSWGIVVGTVAGVLAGAGMVLGGLYLGLVTA